MYTAQNFDRLLGTTGFSDALLKNHFKLYEGYVKNVNVLLEKLPTSAAGTPEYAELKRRFGWEWNGMRLHELYFANMTKDAGSVGSKLKKKIEADFGSFEKWAEDFKATGAMRGIGWAILSQDCADGKLFNVWVNEHDVGHLAGTEPILVMDVFEHAFMLDYGIARADYIKAFWNAIDWKAAEKRLG